MLRVSWMCLERDRFAGTTLLLFFFPLCSTQLAASSLLLGASGEGACIGVSVEVTDTHWGFPVVIIGGGRTSGSWAVGQSCRSDRFCRLRIGCVLLLCVSVERRSDEVAVAHGGGCGGVTGGGALVGRSAARW